MSNKARPIEWQHQEAVTRHLLDGHLTPTTAAPKLAAFTLSDPVPDINKEDDEEEVLANIERKFNMMLQALETRPKCVHIIFDLMICMAQLPPTLTQSGQQLCGTNPPRRVWEDLPCLGRSLGAEWSGLFAMPSSAEGADLLVQCVSQASPLRQIASRQRTYLLGG